MIGYLPSDRSLEGKGELFALIGGWYRVTVSFLWTPCSGLHRVTRFWRLVGRGRERDNRDWSLAYFELFKYPI
jgi:hypothetical protein